MESGVSDQLNAWLSIIFNVITEKGIHLPVTSHLFLEIHQDLCNCNYYFVDHALRTVFWLHTPDIIGIGPPRSFSIGHLRMSLISPFALLSKLKVHVQDSLCRKITGFISNCSPRPLPNILRRHWMILATSF